jgi:hypothetical protein
VTILITLNLSGGENLVNSTVVIVHLFIGDLRVFKMSKNLHQYIQQWCEDHGWTDLFMEQCQFWAFPPGSVIPSPVPSHALEKFYRIRKVPAPVKFLNISAFALALGSAVLTIWTGSPIPLVSAFGFCAIAVALAEEEWF